MSGELAIFMVSFLGMVGGTLFFIFSKIDQL